MDNAHVGTTDGRGYTPGNRDNLAWLFEDRPAARRAIRDRLREFPEYAAWLRGLNSAVPSAVEREI